MKYLIVKTLIFLFVVVSCKGSGNNNLKELGPDKFTWNIQRAGYDFDRCDEMGETSEVAFKREYNSFPWIEEIEKANSTPGKCSPTLTVVDEKYKRDFWISMAGDRTNYGYYVGYIYLNPEGKRWCDVYTTESSSKIDELIELFFDRDYTQFESKLKDLDFDGGLESQDLAD